MKKEGSITDVITIKKKSLKKVSDFVKNKENPFLTQAIESIDKNIVKRYRSSTNTDEKATLVAYDPNTSEILGHTRFVRQIEVDEAQFAKLYLANLKMFFNLSKAGIRVYAYILKVLTPNRDEFFIDIDEALEYTEYTAKSSIYIGIVELIEAEIIARGKRDSQYFINPMMSFNGDRITFAKTYVKKQQKNVSDKRQMSLDLFNKEPDLNMDFIEKEI